VHPRRSSIRCLLLRATPDIRRIVDTTIGWLSSGRRRPCRSPAAVVAQTHHRHSRSVPESAALNADYPLPHPSPAAIFKELDEGGVLLSTADEVYFGVNPVGAQIWALLPPLSSTFGELCTALEQKYPEAGAEQIRMDVQEFLQALIASGLVVAGST
jgi:Coenzyme PQQ synthesis protein D (PqqD)